ncbi:hypothetical protein ACTXT7_004181 [Hymenolepis weldensis]
MTQHIGLAHMAFITFSVIAKSNSVELVKQLNWWHLCYFDPIHLTHSRILLLHDYKCICATVDDTKSNQPHNS